MPNILVTIECKNQSRRLVESRSKLPYISRSLALPVSLSCLKKKKKDRENFPEKVEQSLTVYERRVDQCQLLVFHCTDTHIYVFPLALALSVVHNKSLLTTTPDLDVGCHNDMFGMDVIRHFSSY
jgi:hypothetical protein